MSSSFSHLSPERKTNDVFFFFSLKKFTVSFLQRCQCSPDTSRRRQIFPFNCQHFVLRGKHGKLTTFGPEVVCAIVVLVDLLFAPFLHEIFLSNKSPPHLCFFHLMKTKIEKGRAVNS